MVKVILKPKAWMALQSLFNYTDVERGGILAGEWKDGEEVVVHDIILVESAKPSKACIVVDKPTMLKVAMQLTRSNLRMVGFVHTHLGYGACPSGIDMHYMAQSKRSGIWIIIDVIRRELAGYICMQGRIQRVTIEVH